MMHFAPPMFQNSAAHPNPRSLGPHIRIRISRQIILDQSNYIENFSVTYNMDDAHPVSTPIDGHTALTPLEPNEARNDQDEYQNVSRVLCTPR